MFYVSFLIKISNDDLLGNTMLLMVCHFYVPFCILAVWGNSINTDLLYFKLKKLLCIGRVDIALHNNQNLNFIKWKSHPHLIPIRGSQMGPWVNERSDEYHVLSLLQYILVRLYFHIMLCLGELGGSDVNDNPSSMRSSIWRSRNRCYQYLSEPITLF